MNTTLCVHGTNIFSPTKKRSCLKPSLRRWNDSKPPPTIFFTIPVGDATLCPFFFTLKALSELALGVAQSFLKNITAKHFEKARGWIPACGHLDGQAGMREKSGEYTFKLDKTV